MRGRMPACFQLKAIRVDALGGPEVLRLADVETPRPGPGEALVELRAIGVNYTDVYQRGGARGTPPYIPGFEAAGVVADLGPSLTGVRIGDRVAYAQVPSAYAEFAVVPADRLIAIPDGIDDVHAAALPLQGMTAHFLVDDYVPLGPETVVLIHAAAGGVGLIATQLAARRGAHVIGTTSSDAKAAKVLAAGARHAIRYDREHFPEIVKTLTESAGAHLILDGVGKATFTENFQAVRNRGTIVLYGWPSGIPDPVAPIDLLWRAIMIAGGTLSNHIATRADLERRSRELIDEVLAGRLTLEIDRVLPLADAAEAHRLLEARQTSGKLILVPH
jgi:NADPH2:quinone reductase